MWLYAFGSLLFALAMSAALSVMASDFVRYRRAMVAALRTLSPDGVAVPRRRDAVRVPARPPRLPAAA